MRWLRSAVVVVLLSGAVLVSLAAVVGAGTAPELRNGQIAFVRLSDGVPEATARIMVTDVSGRGERTVYRAVHHMLEHPNWSRDARSIAFASCLFMQKGRCRIGIVDAADGDVRWLQPECRSSAACVERLDPAWSPDGRLLAFTRGWGGKNAVTHWNGYRDVFVMRPDGSGERRVTRLSARGPFTAEVHGPSWSPDGRRLAFGATLAAATQSGERHAVYVVDVDGSDLRRITPWRLNGMDPKWSPDGERIVFRGVPDGDPTEVAGNVYVMRPDGTDVRRLTHYAAGNQGGVQLGGTSPDGRSVVFATSVGGTRGSFGPNVLVSYDLHVMRADGTERRPVTRTGAFDHWPDWTRAR